jgi:hypothetical protein
MKGNRSQIVQPVRSAEARAYRFRLQAPVEFRVKPAKDASLLLAWRKGPHLLPTPRWQVDSASMTKPVSKKLGLNWGIGLSLLPDNLAMQPVVRFQKALTLCNTRSRPGL